MKSTNLPEDEASARYSVEGHGSDDGAVTYVQARNSHQPAAAAYHKTR